MRPELSPEQLEQIIQEDIAQVLFLAERRARRPLSEAARERIVEQVRNRYMCDKDTGTRRVNNEQALGLLRALGEHAHGINNSSEVLLKTIKDGLNAGRPLRYVGFWGIGGKDRVDVHDVDQVESLLALQKLTRKHYPHGSNMTIILSDTHGLFNGYKDPSYLAAIQRVLERAYVDTRSLQALYDKYGIALPSGRGGVSDEARMIFERKRDQLIESAAKHNRTGLDREDAALYYVEMRLRERGMLVNEFPDHILRVDSSKELAGGMLPKTMPALFFNGRPAWFRQEEMHKSD